MKILGATIGLTALLAVGSANATVVYDTTSLTVQNGTKPINTPSHGPLGGSFVVSSLETITSVSFNVKDNAATTGSVLIYLVPNNPLTGAPTLPSVGSGTTLSSAQLLGQIQEAGMFTTFGNNYNLQSVSTNLTVAPGTYWIEMVDAASPFNGSGTGTPTNLQWGFSSSSPLSGLGVPDTGNIFSTSNGTDTGLVGGTSQVFEMQISAPEPASLALFGAGLTGLGFIRRRRAKKAVS